jgi:hypothetical protein
MCEEDTEHCYESSNTQAHDICIVQLSIATRQWPGWLKEQGLAPGREYVKDKINGLFNEQ